MEPLSLNLTDISKTLISILETENIKTSDGQNIVSQFLRIKESVVEVKPASLNSFKNIMEHFSQDHGLNIELINTIKP